MTGDAPEVTGGRRPARGVARRGRPAAGRQARRARGVEGVSDPSDPDSARYKDGAVLPGPGATLAGPTFEEWLAAS